MTRPFVLTMQAHRLDQHRLWTVLLLTALGLAVLWFTWAISGQLPLYAESVSAELAPDSTAAGAEKADGETDQQVRQHCLKAGFPKSARGKISAGKKAVVFTHNQNGASAPALNAVITAVTEEDPPAPIRVELCVEFAEDEPDPLAAATIDRVKIAVGTIAPLNLLFPDLKLRSGG